MNIEIDEGDLVRNKTTGRLYTALDSSIHPAGDWLDSEVTIHMAEIGGVDPFLSVVVNLEILRKEFEVLVPMSLEEI